MYNMAIFGKLPIFLFCAQLQKSAILKISEIWEMCRSGQCTPRFFRFKRTRLISSNLFGRYTMIFLRDPVPEPRLF